MIKKNKFIGVLALLMFTTISLSQIPNSTDSIAKRYNEIGGDMPEVIVETEDSIFITNSDLETNNHLFFVAFNPTCGHCINEAKLICENGELFKDSKVIFVSNPNRKSDLPRFIKETGMDQYPNFIIGVDRNETVKRIEIYGLLPHIIIYDKNHKLVKILSGNTPIEDLKVYLP